MAKKQRSSDFPVPAALTIAGSDSCGGAGIQADLKTFEAFGAFGASVLTAITAQNTAGVRSVDTLSEQMVADQIRACLDDLPIGAIKTGMLASAGIVEVVAAVLTEAGVGAPGTPSGGGASVALVVDPVMIATSGARLLDRDAIRTLIDRLLPLATLATPNLHEAAALTGGAVDDDPEELGRRLIDATGVANVLVKGGHGDGAVCRDWLIRGDGDAIVMQRPRAPGSHHGTGCALSAAITAGLARGQPLTEAVSLATDWLHRQILAGLTPLAGDLKLLPFATRQINVPDRSGTF